MYFYAIKCLGEGCQTNTLAGFSSAPHANFTAINKT